MYISVMNHVPIPPTDLILHPDGSVFHLKVKAEHLADTIFLVGDQNRVALISKQFDEIEHVIENREFITHTGKYKDKRLTALSTGIGTDNIDIVLNELFAAVNINPRTREIVAERKNLNIIRLGTTGALHADISVGELITSQFGLGLDGLVHYYNVDSTEIEKELTKAFLEQVKWPEQLAAPYFTSANNLLFKKLSQHNASGITASGTGFYGPQGRSLFGNNSVLPVQEMFGEFAYKAFRITNFDMETSALYGLGELFGFNCCTVNVVIANRALKTYSKDNLALVNGMIQTVLKQLFT